MLTSRSPVFTEGERSTLANAVRVAMERYQEDADRMRDETAEGLRSLARQFDRQVQECRDLLEKLE